MVRVRAVIETLVALGGRSLEGVLAIGAGRDGVTRS
jgi:hypothetical protein